MLTTCPRSITTDLTLHTRIGYAPSTGISALTAAPSPSPWFRRQCPGFGPRALSQPRRRRPRRRRAHGLAPEGAEPPRNEAALAAPHVRLDRIRRHLPRGAAATAGPGLTGANFRPFALQHGQSEPASVAHQQQQRRTAAAAAACLYLPTVVAARRWPLGGVPVAWGEGDPVERAIPQRQPLLPLHLLQDARRLLQPRLQRPNEGFRL